jgi:hypothetical protein
MYRRAEQAKITFTPEMRDGLRVEYKKAVDADVDTFTFEDKDYFVGYAKYLLEYLDMTLEVSP